MELCLSGRSVLVVDEQVFVSMDIATTFEDAGVLVLPAYNLPEALGVLKSQPVSAAIVDFGTHDAEAHILCAALTKRTVPFIVHSAWDRHYCAGAMVIQKLANPAVLVDAVCFLLDDSPGKRPWKTPPAATIGYHSCRRVSAA